eukprot:39657-Pyramimonas_sp.AAC.1
MSGTTSTGTGSRGCPTRFDGRWIFGMHCLRSSATLTSRRIRGRRPRTTRRATVQQIILAKERDGPARLAAETDRLEVRRRPTRRLRRRPRKRGIRGMSWAEFRPRDLVAAGACKAVLIHARCACWMGNQLYWSAKP